MVPPPPNARHRRSPDPPAPFAAPTPRWCPGAASVVRGGRGSVSRRGRRELDILDTRRLCQHVDHSPRTKQHLIVMKGQQHVRGAAAVGDVNRTLFRGTFGTTGVLVELTTGDAGWHRTDLSSLM